jgi:hypothetical protein
MLWEPTILEMILEVLRWEVQDRVWEAADKSGNGGVCLLCLLRS